MNYWLMSMKWGSKGKDYSELCKKLGILAIGCFMSDDESIGSLRHMNCDYLKSLVRHHSASSLWDFAHEMQIGDVVYIRGKRPGTTVGRARITSEYKYDKDLFIHEPEWEENLYWDHYRKAEWDLDFHKIKASLTKKRYYTIERLKESDVRDFEQKHGLKPFPSIRFSGESTNNGDFEKIKEGAIKHGAYTRYERSTKLRKKAIEIHGYTCAVCGFDFEETYGELGKNFIEVHHKVPLHESGECEPDPGMDMVPLCSNCHRMIHRHKKGMYTVDELKRIVQEQRKD